MCHFYARHGSPHTCRSIFYTFRCLYIFKGGRHVVSHILGICNPLFHKLRRLFQAHVSTKNAPCQLLKSTQTLIVSLLLICILFYPVDIVAYVYHYLRVNSKVLSISVS